MSHQLDAYRLPAGMSVEELLEADDPEELSVPLSEDERRRLLDALAAVDPDAERVDGDQFVQFDSD